MAYVFLGHCRHVYCKGGWYLGTKADYSAFLRRCPTFRVLAALAKGF